MDAIALGILWVAVVLPVGVSAARHRKDSIAEFERALESLQPGGRIAPVRVDERPTQLARRRRVVLALGALVTLAMLAAILNRTRVALGAGVLLVDVCLAYATAVVASDRGQRHMSAG